jgi:hypothetical protein
MKGIQLERKRARLVVVVLVATKWAGGQETMVNKQKDGLKVKTGSPSPLKPLVPPAATVMGLVRR